MRFYNLQRFIRAYQSDDPEISDADAELRARKLMRLLDRLDRNWTNSQKRFYDHLCLGDPEPYFGESPVLGKDHRR